jgi:integrase/recombinase XerD
VWGKGNKVRYIPIHDFLARNFNGSSNYLFVTRKNKQLSDVYIRMMICRKTKQAGINKIISPHTFRRSFATLLNNRGVKISTIQKLLGHASIDTTSTYIHNSYEEIYQELSVKL